MERARSPSDNQALLEQLQVERRMNEMLENSIFEMKNTITDLERKLKSVDDEGSEWKTRYETQLELNKEIERQSHVLQEKSEYLRGNPTDRLSAVRSYEQMSVAENLGWPAQQRRPKSQEDGSLNQYLKRLEDEKSLMDNQLKDFELRMDQEAKAYYKINDERRMYVAEIAQTSTAQDSAKKQAAYPAHVTKERPPHKGKYNTSTSRKTSDGNKML